MKAKRLIEDNDHDIVARTAGGVLRLGLNLNDAASRAAAEAADPLFVEFETGPYVYAKPPNGGTLNVYDAFSGPDGSTWFQIDDGGGGWSWVSVKHRDVLAFLSNEGYNSMEDFDK